MSVHAAMSFSRSRFQNSSNSVGEGSDKARHAGGKAVAGQEQAAAMKAGVVPRPNADVSAADAIEGRAEMPGWQNAFVLGPNVRFTRTPESAFSRRMPVETPHLAEEEAPTDILSETAEPEMVVQPEATVQEPALATVVKSPEPRIQPPRMPFLPQPPDARGARALTYKLRLELARKQAEEAAAAALMPPQPVDAAAVFEAPVPGNDSPVQPLPAASVASVEQVATPQASIPAFAAHLPDELFWEVMTLDLPDDAGEGLPHLRAPFSQTRC